MHKCSCFNLLSQEENISMANDGKKELL